MAESQFRSLSGLGQKSVIDFIIMDVHLMRESGEVNEDYTDISVFDHFLVNPRHAHAQRGLQYLVCVPVCLRVCLSPLILALQAPNRLISDTNGSSATNTRKLMWRFR